METLWEIIFMQLVYLVIILILSIAKEELFASKQLFLNFMQFCNNRQRFKNLTMTIWRFLHMQFDKTNTYHILFLLRCTLVLKFTENVLYSLRDSGKSFPIKSRFLFGICHSFHKVYFGIIWAFRNMKRKNII